MYLFNNNLPTFFETLDRVTKEFEGFANNYSSSTKTLTPKVNLYKGKEGLVLTAKIAGVNPDDLDISIEEKILRIKGEYKSPYKEDISKFHRKEIKTGKFERKLELPFRVETDKIKAEFDSGILKVYMPQADSDIVKKINIELIN